MQFLSLSGKGPAFSGVASIDIVERNGGRAAMADALEASFASLPLDGFDGWRRGRVFGVPLAESQADVVAHCVSQLQSCVETDDDVAVGVFRVVASPASVQEVMRRYEEGATLPFGPSPSPFLVAAVLRHFLTLLPEPLLTFAKYDELIASVQHGSCFTQLEKLRCIIQALPADNRRCLRVLLPFLSQLSRSHVRALEKRSKTTRVPKMRLSALFAPLVVRTALSDCTDALSGRDLREYLVSLSSDLADSVEVCRILIEYHEVILDDGHCLSTHSVVGGPASRLALEPPCSRREGRDNGVDEVVRIIRSVLGMPLSDLVRQKAALKRELRTLESRTELALREELRPVYRVYQAMKREIAARRLRDPL